MNLLSSRSSHLKAFDLEFQKIPKVELVSSIGGIREYNRGTRRQTLFESGEETDKECLSGLT